MAVPNTGELKLWSDIWNDEIGGDQGNNSLHSASVYAGFSTPDAMSDFYGWSDVIPPSVTTNAITNNCPSCQTINATVTSTGGENVTRGFYHGICYLIGGNPLYTLAGTQGTGAYSCTRTGLSCGTCYFNWAYACNSAGTSIGARQGATVPYPPFTPTYVYAASNWQTPGPTDYPQINSGGGPNYKQYANPYSGGLVTYESGYWSGGANCSGCDVTAGNAKNRYIGNSWTQPCNTCYPTPWNDSGATIGINVNRPFPYPSRTFSNQYGFGYCNFNAPMSLRYFNSQCDVSNTNQTYITATGVFNNGNDGSRMTVYGCVCFCYC